MHFGEHITIDGYGGSAERLNDRVFVLNCLNELPEKLGMKKLAEPVIYFAEGNDKKDEGGWSGVVVIEESHISIHTFPARGFVSADVYTCQNGLSKETVISYFKEAFGLQEVEDHFIIRGTRYGDLVPQSNG